MPRIDLIPEVLYQPLDPYIYKVDNLPLINILERQTIMNDAINVNTQDITQSVGDQGSLANRLAQSLEENGSLRLTAIDSAMHNIAEHADSSKVLSDDELLALQAYYPSLSNPVSFVRMLQSERSKLALITDEATDFSLKLDSGISSISSTVILSSQVELVDTDTIQWAVESPNKLKANMAVPESAHIHMYNIIPLPVNPSTPDYINYSTVVPFVEDSLRVYINGFRIGSTGIYVPGVNPSLSWTLRSFTSDYTTGTFQLNSAIATTDTIVVDFDRSL